MKFCQTFVLKPTIIVWNYRLNAIACNADISFYVLLSFVHRQIPSILFLIPPWSNKTTWTWVFYELERNNLWHEQSFSCAQLACLHSQILYLNGMSSSKIIYHIFCYASIIKLWKTFVKTLAFSKIQACSLMLLLDMILLV